MSTKIEREKIIQFKFDSKMLDWGNPYQQKFRLKRRTPGLDMRVVATKAILTGGQPPLSRGEMFLTDVIGTLSVYIEPLDLNGKTVEGTEWIDDILDQDCLFAIHREWLDFQNSFYPGVKIETEPTSPTA